MKRYHILLLTTLFWTCSMGLSAQKTRTKVKAKSPKKTTVVAETPEQKLFKTMLSATAKIMFIDSIVVAKQDFLSKIPLTEEAGKLSLTAEKNSAEPLGQYENGFGDRKFYAAGDTTRTSLYSQTMLGSGWSQPTMLSEFDETAYAFQNFPYLCSDGMTLFFSAKGPHSVGGRDIFMTTLDTDKGKWYDPQNYGLPFNSKANEYLLVINDLDSLGWLVSDRYQNEDSVCIYTFVPTSTRLDFSDENLNNSQLETYANIHSIKDTWRFGNREKAIKRRNTMLQKGQTNVRTIGWSFVVNDDRTITSAAEFKSDESRKLFGQLQELQALLLSTESELDRKRQVYAGANAAQRREMTSDILRLEKECTRQTADIAVLEKRIRQQEAKK